VPTLNLLVCYFYYTFYYTLWLSRCASCQDITSGLAVAKAKGVKLGTPNPEKAVAAMAVANKPAGADFAAKVFPIIQEIKSAGVSTLRGICECLNRRGISTRNGKNWYPATIRNVLKIQTA
jgi:Recombinase